MHQIWPVAEPAPLDDAALIALYRPTDPVLRVNFVSSVDGAVAVDGRSGPLGGPADRRVFGLLRMFADGLMVGAGTLRQEGYHAVTLDPPRRAWREHHRLDPYPRLVVVSRRLDLEVTHPALADAPVRPLLVTCASAPADRRSALATVADVLVHGQDEVDLDAAVGALRTRGLSHLLCEGGPHLFGALAAADLVDEVCLTVSPLLAGPGAGRIIAGPRSGLRNLALAHALHDGHMLLLRYTRAGRTGPAQPAT